MIRYVDFVPRQLAASGFFKGAEYESFDAAVEAASRWLDGLKGELVQVETVVLPNIHHDREEGSGDPSLRASGDLSSYWHQFVRVWYRA